MSANTIRVATLGWVSVGDQQSSSLARSPILDPRLRPTHRPEARRA